jgi:hypothetical protein
MVGTTRRWLVASILTASALGSLATACAATTASAGAQTPAPRVTFAVAQRVYATTWQRFGRAFALDQPSFFKPVTTANAFDVAFSMSTCGCGWVTPHSKVLFSIPAQQDYPESFLAQISTPAPPESGYSPFVSIVVFTKADASAAWQVAYFVRYAGSLQYLDSSLVSSTRKTQFPFGEVPGQLAAFFTSMVTTGSPPLGDNWTLSGTLAEELQGYKTTASDVAAGGDQQQTQFKAVDHSVLFPYPRGDLMCGSYSSSSTVTPSSASSPIIQPQDQSTWSSLLAPGTYSSLSKLGMHDVCFSIDTVDNPQQDDTEAVSFSGGVYQINGTLTAGSNPASAPGS